jgi:hypothetical protein
MRGQEKYEIPFSYPPVFFLLNDSIQKTERYGTIRPYKKLHIGEEA